MKYEIIETGSTGNAIVFNDVVMVDCGVSFKKLTPFYQKLQLVLLTHIHGDHFNKATIKRLAAERPTLRWGCLGYLVAPLVECGVSKGNIDVFSRDIPCMYFQWTVTCFELEHDVPNCGYKIYFSLCAETIVYATDTNSLPDLPDCDFYFIEANYKNVEELEERTRAKLESGEHSYEKRVSDYHMSEEYATNWLVRNGKPSSKHVFLHEHKEK
jgi:hypothetical protein